jgi:hypothetical protein
MIAHKRQLTIEDPERVVLTGLPFRAGQRVEIVILAEEDTLPTQTELDEEQTLPVTDGM